MSQDLDINFENTIDDMADVFDANLSIQEPEQEPEPVLVPESIIYDNIELPIEVFFTCANHYRFFHNFVCSLEDPYSCIIAIRQLYTYLMSRHDQPMFIGLFNNLQYDLNYDHRFRNHKYIDIMVFIIEDIRYIINDITAKIVCKLNKILFLCGCQHLDNVESDHDSDLDESDSDSD